MDSVKDQAGTTKSGMLELLETTKFMHFSSADGQWVKPRVDVGQVLQKKSSASI